MSAIVSDVRRPSASFVSTRASTAWTATPLACMAINANTRACSATNSIQARIVAPLSHANNVTIHWVEAIDGVHLLTVELVEGRSLARLIPEGASPSSACRPFVHRDLKPENVMETTVERTVGGYANNFMI